MMRDEMRELPQVFPVFPLTGCVLFPGNWLPLNIFEPRYLNMVEDALEGSRHIGMVQPLVPHPDGNPDPAALPENPELYSIGCVGHIEEYEQQKDGRYLVLLQGRSRFRIGRELPLQRGYRRIEAIYDGFDDDLQEPSRELDPTPYLSAVSAFARAHDLTFDMERLGTLTGVTLVNGLATALPFAPVEKQALLEAPEPEARGDLLMSLMHMGVELPREDETFSPPTIN